jgi:hypothetical protein
MASPRAQVSAHCRGPSQAPKLGLRGGAMVEMAALLDVPSVSAARPAGARPRLCLLLVFSLPELHLELGTHTCPASAWPCNHGDHCR